MQIKEFPRLGETLYTGVLPNGLVLHVLPKPGFRSRFAVFAANYGGAHRRFTLEGKAMDTPAGVAHYLEHKMFDLPDGDNALNLLSANGADPNAFTASNITCYYFQCTEKFEDNLRLLLHFVSTPYFTEETVQKERGIIAQEIRMGEDSPDSAVYYNLLRQLFASHPIRDRVAGTVESIAEITHETLYACHKVFYAPSNMCLCVEGDVDPERIEALVRELLPGEKAPVPQADFGPEEGLLPVEAVHREAMPVSAPQFLIGAKLRPEPGEAGLRQRIVALLVLRLLVGASSPFYTSLYAAGTLNRDFDYEADFSAGTGLVLLGGESEDPEAVLAALKDEIAKVCAAGFDPAAFERAKRASYGARLRGLEDFESVCVALATAQYEGFCPLDAPALLGELTRAECEAFVRESLRPEYFALSVIEPKKEG
ncbi:MAG: insulinase family protein [Oscillospiraceae bacterium]|nr:insulinase family protein [Oscillospiraceae bacterium]